MIDEGKALAVIIGRAGSKGLPGKNALTLPSERVNALHLPSPNILKGKPIILYSIEDARQASTVDRIVVSTDSELIAQQAATTDVEVIDRPEELATDTATVDAAVRHAVEASAGNEPIIVILYANVPIRPDDLIDRAVRRLIETGADSVQSYCHVGKHHPYWMVTLDEDGRVSPHHTNTIYRRQDLPKVLLPNGGVIVVTRKSLFNVVEGQPHAFLGRDRRGIEVPPDQVVDIDTEFDLTIADVMLVSRHDRQKVHR